MTRTSDSSIGPRRRRDRPGGIAVLLGGLLLGAAVSSPAQPRSQETPTLALPEAIEFTEVKPDEWPPVVKAWIQARRQSDQPATGVVHDGPYSYLIAAAGAQPSSGYRIRFTGVKKIRGRIVATAVLSGPPRGAPVLTVITHPVAVARIERTDLPVAIRLNAKSRL